MASEITDQDLGCNLDYNGSSLSRCSDLKEIHTPLITELPIAPFRVHAVTIFCEQINLSGSTISSYDEYLCEIPC